MNGQGDGIAVVGIGCNFPGGEGLDNFWKVLVEGKNCTVEIPPERFNTKDWYDPDDDKKGKIRTTRAALIDGFNEFDNKLFGINNMEAERMDPQQKLLLECTYRALENAGVPIEEISGSDTGVFIGLMNRDFEMLLNDNPSNIDHFSGTGTAMSIAANRISYWLNLTGPSLTLDTACSSSLVALHYACQAIKQGDCEKALCGGVSLIMDPRIYVALSKAKMISPEGTSKPFCKNADGYGRGEGCGILLLKPLQKAIQECDKIWGVISLSAVNQDGRSVTPITRPSQKQQEKLLCKAYAHHIDPSLVQYVEAHGTGTPAGDPTEAASIGNIIGKARLPGSPALKMGSVKSNIGHTESAAGMAGLIKVLLMMHHEKIVPSLHYSVDNSSINTKELNLYIPTSVQTWKELENTGRIAGVNSFGFGGTNAHVVVKQFKQIQVSSHLKRPFEICAFSAVSSKSLKLTIADTAEQINKMYSLSLQDLAYTSACRRGHTNNKYRSAFVISSLKELEQQLTRTVNNETVQVKSKPNIVFVFCGNGVNYKGMCKMLLRFEPVFRDKFKEIEDALYAYTTISLIDLIENDFEDFSIIEIAQPLLFATQVALVSLLKHWGINPVALVGHSMGEVAAAHCSGLLSLKDAVKVIYHRSILQSKVTGGKMLVVGNVPVAELSKSIEQYSGRVSIAAFNSPISCTLSGEAEEIKNIEKQLALEYKELNIFLLTLDVSVAYHSHMMDPILHSVKESLQDITRQQSVVELISTVSGKVASEDDFTTGQYWARNVREPVEFSRAIQTVCKGKDKLVFVEIGPKKSLERNIKDMLEKETLVYPSIQPNKDYETIFTLIEKLFVQGYNPNWRNMFDGYKTIPTPYPRYQFDHGKRPNGFDVVIQGGQRSVALSHPLLHSRINDLEFICTVSEASTPYIYEHKNNDIVLIPGSFYVELGLASLMNSSLPKLCLGTHQIGVKFTSPCIIKQSPHEIKIQLKLENKVTHFKVMSQNAVYATGEITQNPDITLEEVSITLQLIIQRCTTVIESDEMYATLNSVGFQYGQIFRQLSNIRYGENLKEAIASTTINKQIREELQEYYIHPVVLDAFLQMSAILSTARTKEAKAGFPSSIGSIQLRKPLQEEMVIYMKVINDAEDYIEVCGCFSDKNGTILVELKQVKITFLGTTSSQPNVFFYEHEWEDISSKMLMQTLAKTPKSLIFADSFGIAQNLSPHLHEESTYIMYNDWKTEMESGNTLMFLVDKMNVILSNYDEFLFMWGIHNFKDQFPSNCVHHIAMCSEAYRQVILALKSHKAKASIRSITYRTMETTIDHINPGFGLLGMTRCCVMEIPEMAFQHIDVSSYNDEDIAALAKVIGNSAAANYPEVLIKDGNIYASEIARRRFQDIGKSHHAAAMVHSKMCTLYCTDPYTVTEVSAELTNKRASSDHSNQNIEVQVTKICVHSQDYFPVTDSSYKYGDTLYWKSESKSKHSLLALDFAGTVTAVGKDIKKIKIGEKIVSCYPVTASSKVTLPGDVCYKTKNVPFLKNVPSVSYFLIAWMILHKTLPKVRGQACLAVISSEPKSIFCEVLTLTAKEAGWKAITETPTSAAVQHVQNCSAVVLLSSPDGVLAKELTHFPLLKDIVILGDNDQIRCLQSQIGDSKEHVTVHTLHTENLFQKTVLKQLSKPFYVWLKSMQNMHILNLQYSVFQREREANKRGSLNSYFSCMDIPLIVLKDDRLLGSSSDIPFFDKDENIFKCDAIYMVSGGLTGLGFETVKFIAQHGGSYIVILSRRKPTTLMATEIKALQSQCFGTMIISLQCNVALRSDVENSVTWIRKHFPKIAIKGIFHSAAVFHDGILENLSLAHFENVLSPKVAGAVNLHCATMRDELDYFICYSSIASFIGNPGQSNYAAANSFLDNFCHYRRNLGLSGQSINWGALNLGVLQNQDMIQDILKSKGILTMEKEEIHKMLQKILILNNPQQAVMKLNFSTLNRTVFSFTPSLRTRFNTIMTEELIKLEEISTDHKTANSQPLDPKNYISSLVSELIHISQSDITMNMSLTSLGLDSMLAMTLQYRVFHEKNLKLPLLKLLDPETTIESLSLILEENVTQVYPESKANVQITILEETRF